MEGYLSSMIVFCTLKIGNIMKSFLIVAAAAITFWSVSALAQTLEHSDALKIPQAKISLSGYIVDNQSADANKDNLEAYIKTHPKDCALMPACRASGYSLYLPDGQLLKFTKVSNKKVISFLKNPKNNLQVDVEAAKNDLELDLVSIKNKD